MKIYGVYGVIMISDFLGQGNVMLFRFPQPILYDFTIESEKCLWGNVGRWETEVGRWARAFAIRNLRSAFGRPPPN